MFIARQRRKGYQSNSNVIFLMHILYVIILYIICVYIPYAFNTCMHVTHALNKIHVIYINTH